jgi:UDP-N-acetylglucosamine--N-acetylmuramyl-(pentapeptide) pyrophosphoryl-undecaprenol N-acetylglucosamine transferase
VSVSVLLAGGGTAGHIEPALAVADALVAADPAVTITALGTERGLETTLVPDRGYELRLIPAVPLPRKPSADLLTLPNRMRRAVRETRAVMAERAVDVVVGFGGYVALPAYLAARRRVPVVIHEANARAGLANKIGARWAVSVAAAVDGSGLKGAVVVGNPVRRSLSELDRAALRASAREFFGLDPQAPTLLVFGGSQGAQRINAAVSEAAPDLVRAGVGVLHAHGRRTTLTLPGLPAGPPNVTVAELAAVGLPAVYVPLPHGNGEQRLNASGQVAAGSAIIIEDGELDRRVVVDTVLPLAIDGSARAEMTAAAAGLAGKRADERVARMVLDAVQQTGRRR